MSTDRFRIYFSIGSFSKQSMLYFPCLTFSWNYTQQPPCYSHPQTFIINIKWMWYILENFLRMRHFIWTECYGGLQTPAINLHGSMLKGGLLLTLEANDSPQFHLQTTVHTIRNHLQLRFTQLEIKHKVLNRGWQHVWRHEWRFRSLRISVWITVGEQLFLVTWS